ncbi:peptidylprolyl isomerase [Helicobacter monodelphidis]|uniref:peptidylprolyl isomerase n=1 Tax=Helicobacter sp. 15-1451 TaxID=2004995 RepID=UPI000DCB991C|nr:peptidylprolyl isomerase [Helicobacter sp. 15-1451]RAX57356.1 peptidylprolyl isomerase [Helicobacter sp. 15-1451]
MSGSSQKVKKILASGKNPIVILETTAGNLELELYPKVAPKAVENFLELVNRGYYDGITFHRIIKGFMIQGGDPTGTGRGGESIFGGAFEDEIALGYAFDHGGILAMANAGPNTNRSQFFITTGRASWLNGLHTIFGELKNGFDVLTKLESVRTDENNRPLQTERIIKAKILE